MHSDKVTTTASESRKSTKPIMEKKRRARINASLAELKSLLLVIKKEGSRHSKMEKADILEMTVKHLRQIQRQHYTVSNDQSARNKYQDGFNECVQEVSKYLTSHDFGDVDLKARLLNHLANCISGPGFETSAKRSLSPSHMTSPESTTFSPMTSPESTTSPIPFASMAEQSGISSQSSPVMLSSRIQTQTVSNSTCTITNNNGSVSIPVLPQQPPLQMAKVVSGVQVIPTKLPTGEIAFILPANVLGGAAVPNYVIPMYTSSGSNFSSASSVSTITTPHPFSALTTAPPVSGFNPIMPHYSNIQTCALTPLQESNVLSCSTLSPTGLGLSPPASTLSSHTSTLSPTASASSPSTSVLSPPSSAFAPLPLFSNSPAANTETSSFAREQQPPLFQPAGNRDDVVAAMPIRPSVSNACRAQNDDVRNAAVANRDESMWRPW